MVWNYPSFRWCVCLYVNSVQVFTPRVSGLFTCFFPWVLRLTRGLPRFSSDVPRVPLREGPSTVYFVKSERIKVKDKEPQKTSHGVQFSGDSCPMSIVDREVKGPERENLFTSSTKVFKWREWTSSSFTCQSPVSGTNHLYPNPFLPGGRDFRRIRHVTHLLRYFKDLVLRRTFYPSYTVVGSCTKTHLRTKRERVGRKGGRRGKEDEEGEKGRGGEREGRDPQERHTWRRSWSRGTIYGRVHRKDHYFKD